MKNALKFFAISFAVIFSLLLIGRLTKGFQHYQSPTPANEPTIKQGSKFFASNLVKPELTDFICFYGEIPSSGKQLRISRVCGLEGDIVEIKNGDVFVNRQLLDNKIEVEHYYRISRSELEKLNDSLKIEDESIVYQTPDTVMVAISDRFAIRHRLQAARLILSRDYQDTAISGMFSKPWNQDNFGPVKVPKNKYFVLSDNRHNALDSRYSGFIDKGDFVATVLWKK